MFLFNTIDGNPVHFAEKSWLWEGGSSELWLYEGGEQKVYKTYHINY